MSRESNRGCILGHKLCMANLNKKAKAQLHKNVKFPVNEAKIMHGK